MGWEAGWEAVASAVMVVDYRITIMVMVLIRMTTIAHHRPLTKTWLGQSLLCCLGKIFGYFPLESAEGLYKMCRMIQLTCKWRRERTALN